MKIVLIEPYFSGSHKSWASGLKLYSKHKIEIISLPGKFWKWRMRGGAITLANNFMQMNYKPDLILATDMLDLTTFLSLTRQRSSKIPVAIYFHENQFSYPWSKNDRESQKKRDLNYGFINIKSALVADHVLFNSKYHNKSFQNEGLKYLKNFPDHNELDVMNKIEKKSEVLYLGMDLSRFDKYKNVKKSTPLILWNHRWEYDKNPEPFFRALFKLKDEDIAFKVALLGESFNSKPDIFLEAKKILKNQIVHYGYCNDFSEYAKWVWMADILPVTSNQDFFGGSVVESMYCDTYPLLPNRLTYPELLPNALHSKHIYSNYDDFYINLKKCVLAIEETREFSQKKLFIPYDWKNIITHYDSLFESFIASD
tara:strand:+ start:1901 stop:3007 length:1107 start_codon:yes stop_codon:yes gene_type:complete